MPKSSCTDVPVLIIELLRFSRSIRIWNLHRISMSNKNELLKSIHKQQKLCFKCIKWTYGRSSIDYRVASFFTGYSDLESPSNFQVKEEKNY